MEGKLSYNKKTSFTLIEVLLVVVIITIVVSVATPIFRNTVITVQLANSAQDIAQFMRYLSAQAYAESKTYQLVVDMESKKYYAQATTTSKFEKVGSNYYIPDKINILMSVNPVNFYSNGSIDDASIYLFKGDNAFSGDLNKAINKDFDLGQIQSVTKSEYVYTVKTQPSVGRVKVITPKTE